MPVDLSRLQYLLSQYSEGRCTTAEKQELMLLIGQPENEKEIKQFIEAALAKGMPGAVDMQALLPQQRADELFNNIIGKQHTKHTKIRSILRYAAAAVIISAIAGLGYFIIRQNNKATLSSNKTENKQPLATDALPGSKGAILTLSNGQQIVLDSAGNGQLTSQGSTNIINKNGQIVYDGKGDEATEILYNIMTTPKGRQYQLVLSDGTKVWLNAASSIRYPASFSGDTRNVAITGEAYFEVAKNKEKPFIVKVNDMQVKVLGTHFNINAYHDEEAVRTTLLEGSVQVNTPGDMAMLRPGQQSKFYRTGRIQVDPEANLEEAVAWKEGMFSFSNADIQAVMRQVCRWFDLEVAYEGAIPTDRFGGRLPMDANLSQVLAALEQTQVHFRVEGKRLIVMP